MARKALGPASLELVSVVRNSLVGLEPGVRVRVATSGGADSMALALAASWVIDREHPQVSLSAMIVDHQLQPGSADVAREAARQLGDRGIPTRIERVDVATEGSGLEAAARDARYAALRLPEADGMVPSVVLLGHTLDDQAETVLLGLARGSGTRSLAGMPPGFGSDPRFIRPLLSVRRSTTERACVEWSLNPWHDPHNKNPRFLRARVRHELLPAMADVLGHRVAESLARTAALARDDADLLDAMAVEQLAAATDEAGRLDAVGIIEQPRALRGRVVRAWLEAQGVRELDHERTMAVIELVTDWHGQQGVELPGGWFVRRSGRWLAAGR